MNTFGTFLTLIASSLCLAGCGGGGSAIDQPFNEADNLPINGLVVGNAPSDPAIDGDLNGNLGGELGGNLDGGLVDELDGELGAELADELDVDLGGELSEEFGSELDEELSDELDEALGDEPDEALGDELDEALGDELNEEFDVGPGGEPISDFAVDERAQYRVTIENFWGVEDFPQAFPTDAHLSLLGGATHNVAASFWELGEVASLGIEDMAETGLIDRLLFDEVAVAIENGTANSMIEIREYTDAQINGVPGILTFEIEMNVDWPLVSMVTMLGPSPDWFVGVSGQSLLNDDDWVTELSVDLPIYDGGTKSDITPVMGGPDIIPANPIGLVAYDAASGVYLASDEPQTVARLTFERIE